MKTARSKTLVKNMPTKINKELRLKYKKIRDEISSDEHLLLSQHITTQLKALLESDFKRANIFLCFYPFKNEVGLLSFYQYLLDENKELYFPVSNGSNHELKFYRVLDLAKDFHKGFRDIMEPNDDLPWLSDFSGAIAITPGLIFDEKCNRCGYGAGFYDRFFAKHESITKIGVCFEQQMVNELDINDWDIPLDYIVTNKRLIKRGDGL